MLYTSGVTHDDNSIAGVLCHDVKPTKAYAKSRDLLANRNVDIAKVRLGILHNKYKHNVFQSPSYTPQQPTIEYIHIQNATR